MRLRRLLQLYQGRLGEPRAGAQERDRAVSAHGTVPLVPHAHYPHDYGAARQGRPGSARRAHGPGAWTRRQAVQWSVERGGAPGRQVPDPLHAARAVGRACPRLFSRRAHVACHDVHHGAAARRVHSQVVCGGPEVPAEAGHRRAGRGFGGGEGRNRGAECIEPA
ncbi:unnamed protein product [Chondrus crispus]|uniref:Uncharacterized protein n=1 Tax=Chondrus crispus TaxID=2769 RepID=R7Q3K9_CHOCR|nr:unnamed protein product [Chondrus crispus]CDF32463.1 unnamed protein product [Chondrus crispus]|eukprot:XP_005712128.1 unnamed protein product [Chondrus crispus]